MTVTDPRNDVIAKAIAYLDTADPADVAAVLAQTSIHKHLKADPAALRASLASPALPVHAAHRAAWQILGGADRRATAGANTQARLLAAARSGDLATALAAGTAAADVMGSTLDDTVYSDAGGVLGAAFDTVKKFLLASDPGLAAAVAAHQATLTAVNA
jgi:hypothetical protein